ncbi:MAG: amidohydrolase family protein [Planctomycetota bacterium]
MRLVWCAVLVMCLVGVREAPAEEAVRAFVGATLIPIDGPEIENGVLVIEGGRIAAVGPAGSVKVPTGAEVIDASGRVIMPGLVDTHSHVGGFGGADGSHPIQPGVRIADSLNPFDGGFRRVVAGGLTTLNVMPGSGHLSSGQTQYLKMRLGASREEREERDGPRTIEELFIYDRVADGEESPWGEEPMGGLKMANGTNPMRDPPFPGTRGKAAMMVRQRFIQAQEYAAKLESAAEGDGEAPKRDLDLEALVDVLSGRRIVHHHTHRADDIMTVLRLADEFGFRVVLHHVSEGWRVADEIAAAGVPCSIIIVDSPGGKLEARYLIFETGAVLERAGAKVAYHTDDWITDSRLFLRSAALGVRAGMTREGALRSLTMAGAEMMDLQDRVGSLTVGKDADLVVLSGDPLSVYTQVLETWVEGVKVFDRAVPADEAVAVGGYNALQETEPYFCCYDHLMKAAMK